MFKVGKLRVTLLVLVTCSVCLSINFFVNSLTSSHVASSKGNRREHPRATTPIVTTTASARDSSTTEALLHKQHTQSGNTDVQTSPQDKPAVHLAESNSNSTSTFSSVSVTEGSYTQNSTGKPTLVKSVAINWCPETPPLLEGPLAVMKQDVTLQELMAFYPGFDLGGRLRPTTCTPRERVAIIIPFRNRHAHLYILLNNIIPMLQRQQVDVTFFVIEQADPEIFNRGALFNVGFLEAEKIADFDCFIFHDADLIPINDRNMYRCSSNPRHFAVSMNKFGYRLLYKAYFGGVVGFTKKQYQTVNGCSNVYFGWGGEDDDLLIRVRNKNYTMVRYDTATARYDMMSHQRDPGNEDNPMRAALLNNAKLRQDSEGVSSTQYQVNYINLERFYIWINVSLNMTQVLQNIPDSTLQVIKTEMEKTTVPPTPMKRKEKEKENMLTCFLPTNWNAKILLTLSLVTPDK